MDTSKLSINMNLSKGKCRDYGELDILTSEAGNLRTCNIDVKASILRHYHAVELTEERVRALKAVLDKADDYHQDPLWGVRDVIEAMLAEIDEGEV